MEAGDGGWRRRLETEAGDGDWRRRLETEAGDGGWRRRLETEAGDGGWRRRLEMEAGDGSWRRRLETEAGDGAHRGSPDRRSVTLASSCDQTPVVTLQTSFPSFQHFSSPAPSPLLSPFFSTVVMPLTIFLHLIPFN